MKRASATLLRDTSYDGLAHHIGRKRKESIHSATGHSSLGEVLLAAGDKGVVAILIGRKLEALQESLQQLLPDAVVLDGKPEHRRMLSQVIEQIEKPQKSLNLSLDLRGTDFQQRVWQAVREIPLGQTSSYAEIAERIGAPKAVRAVGTACGSNRFALVVPCHRVLRSDGTCADGLFWGRARQREMLDREAAAVEKGKAKPSAGSKAKRARPEIRTNAQKKV